MAWHLTEDVHEFLTAAGGFLRARPVENTIVLALAETVRERGPRAYGPGPLTFGWWTEGARVTGVCELTPGFPLQLTAMPADAVPALADLLAGRDLLGVSGLAGDAAAFAEAWQQCTGAGAKGTSRMRLYRLAHLVPREKVVPGRPRPAAASDRELLIAWWQDFLRFVGDDPAQADHQVDDKLGHGGTMLWEVAGTPTAMASVTRPDAGMVRIQGVFTPEQNRGRGYGGAVTTALAQSALDAGNTDVVLFTDLDYPPSNALYQLLGFVAVQDRMQVTFDA
jgi:predicted GNAT family acetyltransferase